MMRGFACALALLALTGQANALSCMRADPVSTFQQLDAAPETYVVVHGTFAFDKTAMPRFQGSDIPQNTSLTAQFTGQSLTESGFNNQMIATVTLNVNCASVWCGSMDAGVPQLAFLERRGADYVLDLEPCRFRAFAKPNAGMLHSVTACVNGMC